MHDLENAARPYLLPLLQGRGRALHKGGQHLIATWAVKTAMMFEFTIPQVARGTPLNDYRELFARREPPPNTAVLLASYGGDSWSAYYRAHPLSIGEEIPIGPDGAELHNGQIATLGVGHLVLQVFRSNLADVRLEPTAALRPYVYRVWPYAGSITWMPGPAFNDPQLEAFADALGSLFNRHGV